jgi:hypothetical protein
VEAHRDLRLRGSHILNCELSTLLACRALQIGTFLVLISVRGSDSSGAVMELKGKIRLKKSNDVVEYRTGDLSANSFVSQRTVLPSAQGYIFVPVIFRLKLLLSST